MKYKTNDILIRKENPNYKRKVLGVCDLVVFLSYDNDFEDAYTGVWTEQELDRNYTIEKVDWKPEVRTCYWYIDSAGTVWGENWHENHADQFRLKQKNVFETREEAEERLSELNQ